MYKAGGIIAIIAGIFGIFAAGFTLLFGGLASALEVDRGSTVVALGWGGVGFSFLTIVFGAMALSRVRWAGIGIIICAIAGAILGGTLVAVFMALSLIGGILAMIDSKAKNDTSKPILASHLSAIHNESAQLIPASIQQESKKKNLGLIVGIVLLTVSLIGCIIYITNTKSKSDNSNPQTAQSQSTSASVTETATPTKSLSNANDSAVSEILNAKPDILNHRTIVDCLIAIARPEFGSLSDRNKCENLITKEPILDLTIGVDNVNNKDGKYLVKARGWLGVFLFAFVSPRTDAEKTTLEAIRMGDAVHIKGKLVFDKTLNTYVVNPAYLLPLEVQSKAANNTLNTDQQQINSVPAEVKTEQPNEPQNATNTALPKITPAPIPPSSYQVCNLDGNGEKFLALKEGASASSTRVTKMPEGTALTVLDRNGEWYQVKMLNGSVGWAHSKWLCETNGQSSATEKTPSTIASRPSKSPSFNCQNASTRIERMICSSDELAELDVQLSVAYKNAQLVNSDKELLKKQQDNWRKNNRDTCSSEPCVKSAYRSRTAELK